MRKAPFGGVGVVPGSGATPTLAPPAPDAVPGSGAASDPEGVAEPSAPFAGRPRHTSVDHRLWRFIKGVRGGVFSIRAIGED